MKRLAIILIVVILTSGLAFAEGGKVRSGKAQGNAGTTGGGATTQTRGN